MGSAWVLNKCQNRQEHYIKHLRGFPLLPPLASANLSFIVPSLVKEILIGGISVNPKSPEVTRCHPNKGAAIFYQLSSFFFCDILFIETWLNRPQQSCHVESTAVASPGTPWENGGSRAGFSIGMLACRLSWSHGSLGARMWTGSRGVWKPVPGQGTCPLHCLCPTSLGRWIIPARRLIRSSTGGGSAWTWLTSHPQRFLSGSETDSWRSEVQNIGLKFC